MQDALHIGCSLLGGNEGHTPKSCCLYYAAHVLISRKSEKNLMPRILHFCVPALLLQFQAQ